MENTTSDDIDIVKRRERRLNRLTSACIHGFWIWILVAIFGGYWFLRPLAGRTILQVFLAYVLISPIFVCLFVSNALRYKIYETQRRLRRLEAKASHSPAILVCRSFQPDGLSFRPAVWVANQKFGRHRRDKPSFLNDLANACHPGFLVAIGAPTKREDLYNSVFSLYFQTRDEEWESTFVLAARAAWFIWMIPGTSAGILAEMRTLRNFALTEKTVVFMPPQPLQSGLEGVARPYCDPDHFPKLWKETTQLWNADGGCQLPEYDRNGAIYTCNSDFSPLTHIGLNGYSPFFGLSSLEPALQQLLPSIKDQSGPPISELTRQLEQLEIAPAKPRCIENFYIP